MTQGDTIAVVVGLVVTPRAKSAAETIWAGIEAEAATDVISRGRRHDDVRF